MKAFGAFLLALVVLVLGQTMLHAQSSGWQSWTDNQDAAGLNLFNVGTYAQGQAAPDSQTVATISKSQNFGTYLAIDNTNAGAFAASGYIASVSGVVTVPPYSSMFTVGSNFTGLGGIIHAGDGIFLHAGASTGQDMVFMSYDSTGVMRWAFTGVPAEAMELDPSGLLLESLSGTGTRCVQVNAAGRLASASTACGTGAGTVTSVSATDPLFITGGASPTPNVVGHGLIVSGDTVTSGQNLGALTTGLLKGTVAAGVSTISTAVAGTDYQVPLTACADYVSLSCVTATTDLGGSNLHPTVNGFVETGGPQDLKVGAIAADQQVIRDGSNAIVGRPRGQVRVDSSDTGPPDYLANKIVSAGGTISLTPITGDSLFSLDVTQDQLSYFVTISLTPGEGYIATSNSTAFLAATVEYPTTHQVAKVNLCVNLIANGIITGNPLLNITRNGSGIGGGSAINFSSSTTPGIYCTGYIASGSASASDTYGLTMANSATGTMTYTATLVLR